MTGGKVDTSLEVWELTLPEDEAKCATPRKACANPAAWHSRMTPCGHGTLLCTPCKADAEHLQALRGLTFCLHCRVDVTSWTAAPI